MVITAKNHNAPKHSPYLGESQLIQVWRHELRERTDLTTEEGERVRVIYPGRANDGRGADLVDAVILINGEVRKGAIEVHTRSSSWWLHGHHLDPAYCQVILHAVYLHDSRSPACLANGKKVGTLVLGKYLKSQPSTLCLPCCKRAPEKLASLISRAGDERFLSHTSRFQSELREIEGSQALYQGIMEALGYSKNKLPFLELARRLPLTTMEEVGLGRSYPERLARQQALLLGAAGLLPSQRSGCYADEEWAKRLEELWVSYKIEPMSANSWCLCKIRPGNSPVRRLAAMSHLIARTRGGLQDKLNGKDKPDHRRLENLLMVNDSGYWASHYDFGSVSLARRPALLGKDRAADIIVNVLLPFAFAWGKSTDRTSLAAYALELYHHYPRLQENTLERHMVAQLGINRNMVSSAQRQQGLIHIFKTYCSRGECTSCPLGS